MRTHGLRAGGWGDGPLAQAAGIGPGVVARRALRTSSWCSWSPPSRKCLHSGGVSSAPENSRGGSSRIDSTAVLWLASFAISSRQNSSMAACAGCSLSAPGRESLAMHGSTTRVRKSGCSPSAECSENFRVTILSIASFVSALRRAGAKQQRAGQREDRGGWDRSDRRGAAQRTHVVVARAHDLHRPDSMRCSRSSASFRWRGAAEPGRPLIAVAMSVRITLRPRRPVSYVLLIRSE